MEKNSTIFKNLKDLINSTGVGEVISRQELVKLNDYGPTIDVYRRTLEVKGYLKTVSRGKYLIVKEIPLECNSRRAK